MATAPGEYKFTSDGSGGVCGLYVISPPEQVVEMEFPDFHISCESGGLLAVGLLPIDYWRLISRRFFVKSRRRNFARLKQTYFRDDFLRFC